MRTGPTLIIVAIALAAGGFAGYRLAMTKPEAAVAPVAVDGQKGAKIKSSPVPIVAAPISAPGGLPGPLGGAEQRRNAGGSRRALFEARSPELRSRPAFRVAQGTRAAGTDPGVVFSLATFFLPSKRKYARASGAETNSSEKSPTPENEETLITSSPRR